MPQDQGLKWLAGSCHHCCLPPVAIPITFFGQFHIVCHIKIVIYEVYVCYIPHHIHLDMEMDGLEMTSNFLKYNRT